MKYKNLIIILTIILSIIVGASWNDCTRGNIDDPCYYPGDCNQYIDTNSDGICDHSQPEPTTATTSNNTTIATSSNSTTNITSTTPTTKSATKSSNNSFDSRYYVKYIAPSLLAIYLVSIFILPQRVRRKLWNVVLAVFFFLSAITGVLLAIGINIYIYPSMLYWHVETGIAMAIIGFIHFMIHIRYYYRIFAR